MRRIILPLVVLAALISIFGWAGAQNTTAPATGDGEALRQAATAYGAALDKGDVAAIVATWTADADYVDDNGTVYKGRDAIGKLFQAAQATLKESKVAYKLTSVRYIKPDVAITDGDALLTSPDGTTDRTRFTAVWMKEGGRWLIASARDLPTGEEGTGDARLKDLDWLIGDWLAEEKDTKVNLSCRWTLDNKFLRMEFSVSGAKTPFTVVQLVGWDPTEGQIHSWTFDSRGGFGESTWVRESGEWIAITSGVMSSGQIGNARNGFRAVGPNGMVWKSREREVDGRPIPDHELKYMRLPVKP